MAGLGRKGSHPDFVAAGLFIGAGLMGVWQGAELDIGEAASMGPGYFPLVLSLLLLLIGVLVFVKGVRSGHEPLARTRLRPVIAVLVAIAGFALLAKFAGFILAAVWLMAVASLADPESQWRQVVLSTVVLTLFTVLVFIVGLGMQIPLWPF